MKDQTPVEAGISKLFDLFLSLISLALAIVLALVVLFFGGWIICVLFGSWTTSAYLQKWALYFQHPEQTRAGYWLRETLHRIRR